MTKTHRRLISFAGNTVAIETTGAALTELVNALFNCVPDGDDQPPHITFHVKAMPQPGHVTLYRSETSIYEGNSYSKLADLLISETCYHLAVQSHGGLLFHAAAMAWGGQGILMPGKVGAGKTTLAAWLTRKGFTYLTDELVFIPEGEQRLLTLPRPLSLKKTARIAIQEDFNFEQHAREIWSTDEVDLIPPHLLNTTNTWFRPVLSLILFPHYQPSGAFKLDSLSKAQAGLRLMEHAVNARNLAGHGFAEIIRLARLVPAWTMRYSNFDQVEEQIKALGW